MSGVKKLERNITMNSFGGKIVAMKHVATAANGEIKWLGTVIGRAYAAVDKVNNRQNKDGTVTELRSIALVGTFRAVSHETGEVFDSGTAYLPGYVAEMIKALLTNNPEGIDLAFDVGVEKLPPEKMIGAVAYTWVALPKLKKAVDDPINVITAMLQSEGNLGLLPAPEVRTAPAITYTSSAPEDDAPEHGDTVEQPKATKGKKAA